MSLPVELSPYRLPLSRPLATARGPLGVRAGLLVRIAAEGLVGIGECAPLPGFGTETLEAAEDALQQAAARLVGVSPPAGVREIEALVASLPPAARAGLEGALLGWLAARLGLRPCDLLAAHGGLPAVPRPAKVLVAALLLGEDPAREAAEAVERGYAAVKLKVAARPLGEDVARVLAVRRAIGSGRALRLDANGGYGPAQAEVALRAFALHAPELCEQPVAPGQTRVWKGLSAICPLAADESCADPLELDELLRARALVAVVLKPAVLGGLLPALAIARRARAQGAEPILSTALESRVGRAAAAHLAAALRSRLPAGLGSGGLFAADLPADLREEGGALSFPSEAQSAAGPAGVLSGQGAP